MPSKRRNSFTTDPNYKTSDLEIKRSRSRDLFVGVLCGRDLNKVAAEQKVSVATLRLLIGIHAKYLWRVAEKWRQAEVRCRAMALELNLLRLGKEAAPDRPIEILRPIKSHLDDFKRAGVHTVNQLRSVDPITLTEYYRFKVAAIEWAVLTLDKKGLSHRLSPPRPPVYNPPVVVPKQKREKATYRTVVIGHRKFRVRTNPEK